MVRLRSSGVNFINILHEPFRYETLLRSFPLITVGFVIFWQKNIGEKAARKMLMKLATDAMYVIESYHRIDVFT